MCNGVFPMRQIKAESNHRCDQSKVDRLLLRCNQDKRAIVKGKATEWTQVSNIEMNMKQSSLIV